MTDREKIIKGLEQFKADLKPYCGNRADWEKFDAGFAMLKEQDAVTKWFYHPMLKSNEEQFFVFFVWIGWHFYVCLRKKVVT